MGEWLASIHAYFRRRRLAREERVVATAEYLTVNDDKTVIATHFMVMAVDGNGNRYERVETTRQSHADTHSVLLRHRVDWQHHAAVPPHAKRVHRHGGANLVLLNGGGSDAE